MRQLLLVVTVLLALAWSAQAVTAGVGTTRAANAFAGTWAGPAHQAGALHTDFTVKLSISKPASGSVGRELLSVAGAPICKGTLRYRDTVAQTARFALTITAGKCTRGIVSLTPTRSGKLQYVWQGIYANGTAARSQGLLSRLT